MSSFIVVGSSNVIFTHSYCLGLKERGLLSGYVDIGRENLEHPEYLTDVPTIRLYNKDEQNSISLKNRFVKLLKILLKKTGLDRKKHIIKLLDIIVINKITTKKADELNELFMQESDVKVLYLWSTTVKKEKEEIDRLIGPLNSTLIVNTYPVRSNSRIDQFDSSYLNDSPFFNSFERLFVPTVLMRDFLRTNCNVNSDIFVSPDHLHPIMYKAVTEHIETIPHKSNATEKQKLIFLGNTNFSERTIDDVSSLIQKIADNNIEVYLQGEPANSTKFIKYFKPFTYQEIIEGKLASFMSKFDSALVAYNKMNNARTNISYPTRFALSLLSCKTIYMEKDVFKGIQDNECVVLYDSWEHLIAMLSSKIDVLSAKHGRYSAEYHDLIDKLVEDANI